MPIDELKKLQETLYELSDQLPNKDECDSLEDEVCGDIANLRDSLARLLERYE